MFLNNLDQIFQIANQTHFSIFEFPKNLDFPSLPKAINISPNDKNSITVEDIHGIEQLVRTKQLSMLVITINQADSMTKQAQNCFLKLLEEPGNHIRFVFFVHSFNKLLPTVRSRAHIFHLKSNIKIDTPPAANPKTIALAKQYISVSPRQLATLSASLAKNREATLEMLDVAIELLFKSYFKTGNHKFLDSLKKLNATRDNVAQNGHIRLQLVAGML